MVAVPKISVITPTVRGEAGLKLVKKALNRQTFHDFEHIIVEPEGEKPPELYWTVYRDYNRAVRLAKGELIVSWQDFTYADPDALEKFWEHHAREPKTLVTAVGNKYADENFIAQTWQDPRIRLDQGSFYRCFPNDIEWNLCAVPTEAIYAVGGFDEYMDKYSSLCGLDVLMRLNTLGGYDFKIDQTIRSYSTEHGRLPEWEEHSPFRGAYDKRVRELIDSGAYPVLQYLSKVTSKSGGSG